MPAVAIASINQNREMEAFQAFQMEVSQAFQISSETVSGVSNGRVSGVSKMEAFQAIQTRGGGSGD